MATLTTGGEVMENDNLGVIIAISFGMFTIVASMVTMLLWTRTEANSDRRYHNDSLSNLKKDLDNIHRRK